VHEVYHPSTDTWTTAAPLPVATQNCSATSGSGGIYLFSTTPEAAFKWNSADDTWTELSPPPWSVISTVYVVGLNTGDILVGTDAGLFWIYETSTGLYWSTAGVTFSPFDAMGSTGTHAYATDFDTGEMARFSC
jgi:hypothetical protein